MSMAAVGLRTLTQFVWPFFSTVVGTALIFMVALLTERFKAHPLIKNYVQALVLLPLAVPGLVLGIAYILF